jgi:hypothetical protein
MDDYPRITTLDLQMAHAEWRKMMDENLKRIRMEPYNTDEIHQAHLMNRFKDNDEYRIYRRQVSGNAGERDTSSQTVERP